MTGEIFGPGQEAVLYRSEHTKRKELEGAKQCLDYLLYISEHPEARKSRIVAVSEPILDVFMPVKGTKPGRESAADELVIEDSPELMLGGGTNVVRGIAPFAREVELITRVGAKPPFSQELQQLLDELPDNVQRRTVMDPDSTNAVKIRYVGPDGKVIYCMNHNPKPLSEHVQQDLIEQVRDAAYHTKGNETVVVSDYGRGLCTPHVMEAVSTHFGEQGLTVVIDPRPGKDNQKYNVKGGLLKPNRGEAETLTGVTIDGQYDPAKFQRDVALASNAILDRYPRLDGVILSCDVKGSVYTGQDNRVRSIHAKPQIDFGETKNPSGAGDIVIATVALLHDTFPRQDYLQAATLLASRSVTDPGTSTLSPKLVRQTKSFII